MIKLGKRFFTRILVLTFTILSVFTLPSVSKAVPLPGSVTITLVSFTCTSVTISYHNNDSVNSHSQTAAADGSIHPALGSQSVTIPANGNGTNTIVFSPAPSVGELILVFTAGDTPDNASFLYTCTSSGSGSSATTGAVTAPCPIFSDGRLNNCDAGETAAVYCEKDGSVKVLAIWQSKGYAAILASPDEIAKVPKNPTVNTAIKSGNGATLYRLMGGNLQVNRAEDGTGKTYHFVFSDCPKPQ